MALIKVTQSGVYNGKFLKPGQSYDDGLQEVDQASNKLAEKPAKTPK
jgi:hypothetical protein